MEQQPIQHYISAITGIEYNRPSIRKTYKVYYPEKRKEERFIAKREEFKDHLKSHGFTDQEIKNIYG